MKIKVDLKLLNKKVMIDGTVQPVYGLASFYVTPQEEGIGTYIIRCIEEIAEKHNKFCIIAFCLSTKIPFYKKSGWYECGTYDNRLIVASKYIPELIVNEKW